MTRRPPPPPPVHWCRFAAAGLTAVGMSIAAAVVSLRVTDPEVGITAWIAVAVVGTAAVISAAVSEGPPRPPRDHDADDPPAA
ncbi:MAG: hypothetical protein KDA58_05650 [Planctomycetaceae bacterium]|nr:hypothetical protein [Planctomycetaceae bacterium]